MDYPREIYLDQDTEQKLMSYLDQEILNNQAERASFVQELAAWQTDYFAKPTTEVKTFPFVGAANIVIPLSAISVESIHAKTMTTLFALDQFASIKTPDQFGDIDNELTQFTDHTLLKDVNMYDFCNNTLLESLKFGACVGKSGYERIIKRAVKQVGDEEHEFDIITSQGPTAEPVPLANFLMPYSAMDPQKSPWVGEEHLQPAYQVKVLSESGFFRKDTYENLLNWILQNQQTTLGSAPYTIQLENLQNQTPVYPKSIGWYEIWMAWDVDGSGKSKEIVVHYHRLARKIMSCRYNWREDLSRPYRIGPYFPVENRWLGLGACKMNEQFQREITVQHRQRLDNATLANMRMIKINKLAGYGAGEPVFPGKIWLVDSKDDIDTMQMGEIYPSSYNNETATLQYQQQRLGVNELNLGMPSVGTPGTASSDMSRLQEGSRKFDFQFKNQKTFVQQISKDVMLMGAQFGWRDNQIFDYIPNGQLVQAFFKQPISLLRNEIVFQLSLAGQNQNKLLDRAAWTQLAGIFQQYYTGMFQLAQMSGQPQVAQALVPYAMSAGTEAMKKILESFDINNIDRLLLTRLILQNVQNPGPALPSGDPQSQGAIQGQPIPNNPQAAQASGQRIQ